MPLWCTVVDGQAQIIPPDHAAAHHTYVGEPGGFELMGGTVRHLVSTADEHDGLVLQWLQLRQARLNFGERQVARFADVTERALEIAGRTHVEDGDATLVAKQLGQLLCLDSLYLPFTGTEVPDETWQESDGG